MKNRVQSLDYLRGLMALGIMVYHYFTWTGFKFGAETFPGKIGIYGVSVFYVLSGLTLFIVYNNKLSFLNIHHYFIKRVFRIFPLLWLSILLSVFLLNHKTDLTTLLLNLTGLFGFVAHDRYIAIASWSIGNELVFYTIFPLILLSGRWTRFAPHLFFLISAGIGVYFAFSVMIFNMPLRFQWSNYLNPLNQVMLFSGGVLIGRLLSGKKLPPYLGIALLAFAGMAFIFYPVKGDQSTLIAGFNRIAFVLLSFAITASFLMIDFKPGKIAGFILSRLGEASYSVYLLHPIVYLMLKKHAGINYTNLFLLISFTVTLLLSYLVYTYFETRFISLGQSVINKLKSRQLISAEEVKH
ncbi:MAG: acyltransferase [Lentimicrobium sp.]|nr:acyltransferase [Lentimicrobium sp.]